MAKSWCSKAHFGSLLSKLKQLQTDDLLTDTTIKAGTQEFKVHRAVLIACCGYSPFNLDVQEGSQSTITIDDLPSDSVMQLLNFCYTGSLNLSDENILDIINSAGVLQMEHAIRLSFDYVKETKRCDVPSHWKLLCEAASLAASHGFFESFELCLDKIAYWFSAIYKTEMFKKLLTYEILHKLLDRPELTKRRDFAKDYVHNKDSIALDIFEDPDEPSTEDRDSVTSDASENLNEPPTEDQVLEAVIGWLKHDWENRKCHIVSLLGKVRLGTIDSSKLDELIDQDMRAIQGCQDILRVVEEKKKEGDPSPAQPPLSITMPEMFCPRGTIHTLISIGGDSAMKYPSQVPLAAYFRYDDDRQGCEWWLPLKNFPRAPEGMLQCFQRVIAVNGHLYITNGTGEKGKSFYKFDPCACRWDAINFCHPTDLYSPCSLVYLDGWIYALGGQSLKVSGAQWARRYNIQEDKEEVLHPEKESMTTYTSAVAYLGKVLMYGLQKQPDKDSDATSQEKRDWMGNHTLSVYDPATNKWFVVFTEEHQFNECENWNAILFVHEGKCYRILYEDAEDERGGDLNLKPRVNELVFDLETETPSCHLGESQDQYGFVEAGHNGNGGKFYINGDLFVIINGNVVKTGHKMSPTDNVNSLRGFDSVYRNVSFEMPITHYAFDLNKFE